jgi:hypothetical protein
MADEEPELAEVAPVFEPTPAPAPEHDLDGIKLRFEASGQVTLRGKDQWGGDLDVTFESLAYFANAVPVLERYLTAKQAAALRDVAKQRDGET